MIHRNSKRFKELFGAKHNAQLKMHDAILNSALMLESKYI